MRPRCPRPPGWRPAVRRGEHPHQHRLVEDVLADGVAAAEEVDGDEEVAGGCRVAALPSQQPGVAVGSQPMGTSWRPCLGAEPGSGGRGSPCCWAKTVVSQVEPRPQPLGAGPGCSSVHQARAPCLAESMAATTMPFPARAWAMKSMSPRLRPSPWWKTTEASHPPGVASPGWRRGSAAGRSVPSAGVGLKAPVPGVELVEGDDVRLDEGRDAGGQQRGRDAPLERHDGGRHRLRVEGSAGSVGSNRARRGRVGAVPGLFA